VTSYRVTPYVGSTPGTSTIVSGSAPPTSTTVTGLTTGTTYTFTVRAVTANGAGDESAKSNAVTPRAAVVPTAPGGVLARPASRSALVTWTASSNDGDSAITGYTVTPYDGATAQTPVQVGASATSATVSGLTNGTSYTFKVTATNGVGDSPASAASDPVTPQATIFDFATPATVDGGDTGAVELGVKFTADDGGSVTGIRFYKAAANTGPHTGSLWSASGTRLAQATFTNESATGWQTATFASPVPITAGTTYVASYFAPNGHYSLTTGGLSSAVDNGPLHAVASSASPNGVFSYGGASLFPTSSFKSSDYGVDVLLAAPVAPAGATAPAPPGSVTAQGDTKSAIVSWAAPSSDGGSPITGYTVTPYAGATALAPTPVGASTTATRVGGLTNGTSYTFKVAATNAAGTGSASAASSAVTPQPSIFELGTPATLDSGDTSSVNLGVKFTPDVAGSISGVRFYKAAGNTGTHVGALWSAGGQLLGQATFTGESASGWQTVTFATPVPIAAGTTYVASYLAPKGHYSVTGAGLATGVDNPPLHAVGNNASPNGLYVYGALTAFPASTFNASNYWVDVLFAPAQ
jgi:hypothetical protein